AVQKAAREVAHEQGTSQRRGPTARPRVRHRCTVPAPSRVVLNDCPGTRRYAMCERNRIDNPPEPGAVPVELTLTDGTVAKVKLLVPAGKALADLLNGGGGFVEFEPYGGERRFVAKSQLASVRPVGVPRVPNLAARAREADSFDPYALLGVPRGAAWEEIRQAYHRLAKAYHPDR